MAATAAGCFRNTRGPCDTPPPFHVQLVASGRVNPDAQGQPLPTAVELFQLKGVASLEKTDLNEVLRAPKEALGEDLLRADELRVDPGQSVCQWVGRDPKTTYLAAVGVFRQASGTSWRALVPVPQLPTDQCVPVQPERKDRPTEKDLAVRLYLDDFRITPDSRPSPLTDKDR